MADDLSIDSVKPTTLTGYSTKVDTDAEPEGYIDFDGYLKLMVAQMSNQDFNDPMSDSEFLNQMATYSMMDTISKMNEQSQISYAASLVGKAVTVEGENGTDTGVVESVIISDGKYQLLVNGTKYDSDKVTDIVDSGTYNTLTKLVGVSATATTKDGEKVTGAIQNIIIKDGTGYAVIGGNLFPFDSLDFESTDQNGTGGTDNADGTDNAGSTDGTDNADGTGGTDNTGSTGGTDNTGAADSTNAAAAAADGTSTASVSASKASMFLADDGVEVIDRTAINNYANQKLAEYYSSVAGDGDAFELEYTDEDSAVLEAVKNSMTPAEAAGAARQRAVATGDGYYSTSVENVASMFSSKNDPGEESGVTVRRSEALSNNSDETDEDYDYLTDIDVKGDTVSVDDEEETEEYFDYEDVPLDAGVDSAEAISMAAAGQAQESGKVTAAMTSSYTQKVSGSYLEDPGVNVTGYTDGRNSSYAQWPLSNRAFQNLYPNEAALANEYGTKMFDIRFIHNTDINSVINTDLILGSTISGRYFTDIGYSGKGKLGEVVTWADGSQRVEIIGRTGSTWYTTTGNYTLDEICDFSENYKLNGKLSPFETVIRAAAKEYTPAEQEILNRQRRAYAQHAYYNSAELLGDL